MEIKESGFYKTSELKLKSGSSIDIAGGLRIFLYDDSGDIKEINIAGDSQLEYFSFFDKKGEYTKNFNVTGENSQAKIHSLVYSSNKKDIKLNITGESKNSKTQIFMKLLSFSGEDGIVDIDGVLKINKGLKKVEGRLEEENIFLGSSGMIKGIPTLLVESSDVDASHACNIEKISDEKLFYLRSRGVGKENALYMIIKAKISNLYKCLKMLDNKFYEQLINNILTKIK